MPSTRSQRRKLHSPSVIECALSHNLSVSFDAGHFLHPPPPPPAHATAVCYCATSLANSLRTHSLLHRIRVGMPLPGSGGLWYLTYLRCLHTSMNTPIETGRLVLHWTTQEIVYVSNYNSFTSGGLAGKEEKKALTRPTLPRLASRQWAIYNRLQ